MATETTEASMKVTPSTQNARAFTTLTVAGSSAVSAGPDAGAGAGSEPNSGTVTPASTAARSARPVRQPSSVKASPASGVKTVEASAPASVMVVIAFSLDEPEARITVAKAIS